MLLKSHVILTHALAASIMLELAKCNRAITLSNSLFGLYSTDYELDNYSLIEIISMRPSTSSVLQKLRYRVLHTHDLLTRHHIRNL